MSKHESRGPRGASPPPGRAGGARTRAGDEEASGRRPLENVAEHGFVESLLAASPDLVYVWDREQRYHYVTPAGAKILGFKPAQMLGHTWRELGIEPSLGGRLEAQALRVFDGGEPVIAQVEFAGASYEYVVNPVLNDAGEVQYALIWGRDITDQRHAERRLREEEARLRHMQKLESLGLLAGGIAHDFNNLLVGVLGNASLALLELPKASPVREYLDAIRISAQRAAGLSRQLLAYAGRGELLLEPLDLSELVREAVHDLAVGLTEHAELALDLARDLPDIRGDYAQLRQVLTNLVANACEALGNESGRICIGTSTLACGDAFLGGLLGSEGLAPGRYVALRVSDDGPGMLAEVRARIFDPFFTTKADGRGLGLSVVMGLVRGHGGGLTVKSDLGAGTEVTLVFPVAVRASLALEERQEHATWRGQGRILVVDDEVAVRTVLARLMPFLGFEVVLAADGEEGLRAFAEHEDALTLVLLDLTMPKLGGLAVFEAIRAERPDMPAILTSGYDEQDVIAHALDQPRTGFVHKPFTLETLRDVMRELLDG